MLNPWHAARRFLYPQIEITADDDIPSPFYSVALPDAFASKPLDMNKQNYMVNMMRSQTKSFTPLFKRAASGYRNYIPAHKRLENQKKFEIMRFGRK